MQVITINLIAVLLLLAADGLLSLTDIERAMGLKVPHRTRCQYAVRAVNARNLKTGQKRRHQEKYQ